jgi:hypothetical protein
LGDGDVAFKASVPFWQVKHHEASRLDDTLMYKVAGFDGNHDTFACEANDTLCVWGPGTRSIDSTNAVELTNSEIEARLSVYDDLEEKKQKNPAYKNAHIVETGPLIGIRQTRFIEGLYKITGEDVIEGKIFDDFPAAGINKYE